MLAVQVKHAVWPVPPWYLPASHLTHSDWLASGWMVPSLHNVWLRTPVVHEEPSGQAAHWSEDSRPWASLYLPPGHGSSADAPDGQ